jgi:hypothetical protein
MGTYKMLLVDFIEKCTDLEENCEVEGLVE